MKIFKILLILFALFTSVNIFSNSFSEEANFIIRNTVNVSRLDSLYFVNNHHIDDRSVVARTLINYKSKNAIALFKKLINDERSEYQNYAIFPLMNVGEFEIAFKKYKELTLNNKLDLVLNCYRAYDTEFGKLQQSLYNKHKDKFIPFLKEFCKSDSFSIESKMELAIVLFNLNEKRELEKLCVNILEKVPAPTINYYDQTEEEHRNSALRHSAITWLRQVYKDNPFGELLDVNYSVENLKEKKSLVEISVYDIKGDLIRNLFSGYKPNGRYNLEWDKTDNNRDIVAPGIYYCIVVIDGNQLKPIKKLILK